MKTPTASETWLRWVQMGDQYQRLSTYWPGKRLYYYYGGNQYILGVNCVPADEIVHIAGVVDPANNVITARVNGVVVAQTTENDKDTSAGTYPARHLAYGNGVWIDEVRYTLGDAVYEGTTTYYPHLYEAGSAVLTYTSASNYKVTDISWTGAFGTDGKVSGVYVNEGTDASPSWTQVGGADPTSPISGLSYVIAATVTKPVKFALAPKSDSLQSATPTLSTASMTTGAVYDYTPDRETIILDTRRKVVTANMQREVVIADTRRQTVVLDNAR